MLTCLPPKTFLPFILQFGEDTVPNPPPLQATLPLVSQGESMGTQGTQRNLLGQPFGPGRKGGGRAPGLPDVTPAQAHPGMTRWGKQGTRLRVCSRA